MSSFIYHFSDIDHSKVHQVGGKNASLGEMFLQLESKGIRVPDGFATTAEAYRLFIDKNSLRDSIRQRLDRLDRESYGNLKETGAAIRKMFNQEASMPEELAEAIRGAYRKLREREENLDSVAVRSSATAEDLPEASFAGQHESFMNVRGEEKVVTAVQKCMASLFTDRAIKYREDQGFDHMKIALSAGVQKMVRSDHASAGVAFTIEPETGFDQVIFINGSWGLGDNVVGGEVRADRFLLYKENLRNNKKAILSKNPGSKEKTLVYSDHENSKGQNTVNTETPAEKRNRFILSDDEIEQLGRWCLGIEEHYRKPMDIEWAKDGETGDMYIVQARPETVHSAKEDQSSLKQYTLEEEGPVLVTGNGIGDRIASGKARILDSPEESDKLEEGDVLITEITNPDWDPVLRKASAIVTNSGGRTSHAAIVARELGAVAVVGAEGATEKIRDGQDITVSCTDGPEGRIYEGQLKWDEKVIDMEAMGDPDTDIMLILANPESAFGYAGWPVDGVGLVRLEFTVSNAIRIHPMALVRYDDLESGETRKEIDRLTAAYPDRETYFIEKLSMAAGTIAASFYPKDVIIRMSDFKSNEYADLTGGKQFEPEEENPMLGFRGASRYYSNEYREGFRLECLAMKRAREEMGFDNIKLMIPFCRTVAEGGKVIREMEKNGLRQGEDGLEIYVMSELPSNVIGTEEFAGLFDGFSIGSNDLTQLVLGVDRDQDLVSDLFDERNPQVKEMITMAIQKAQAAGKKIGLCGQGPSDFPEIARFLIKAGIDSISFNPDAFARGLQNVLEAEKNNSISR
ncbi:MAG: phosphoenolpyruvate synthase [Balneolaceae bacterium]